MSPKETESKSSEKESKLEVIKREDNGDFIVKTENARAERLFYGNGCLFPYRL